MLTLVIGQISNLVSTNTLCFQKLVSSTLNFLKLDEKKWLKRIYTKRNLNIVSGGQSAKAILVS